MTRHTHGVAHQDWGDFAALYRSKYDRLLPDEDEWTVVPIEEDDTV